MDLPTPTEPPSPAPDSIHAFGADAQADAARRNALLRRLHILDTPPEPGFDGLTRAAALLTGCPISVVSLLDEDRQWFKSRHGVQVSETPISMAFCAHAVRQPGLFEVDDAQADPRFAANPLVVGEPGIRFYAGRPLALDGVRLGTLCVIDTVPRHLTPELRLALDGLADAAAALLAARQTWVAQAAQQRRLVDIALASGDAMWESDAGCRVEWTSAEARAGQANATIVVGEELPDGLLLDARGALLRPPQTLHDALVGSPRVVHAVIRGGADERPAYLSFSAIRRLDESGRPCGFSGTVRDVSAAVEQEIERYEGEVALRLDRDAANQTARLRSELVARVSHELRTPLNAVLGFSELLLHTPQEVTRYATHIHRAGTHLLGLVNDMLELAKLESGSDSVELRAESTTAVMQRCIDLLEPGARARGVRMGMHTGKNANLVVADRRRLLQALLNLANNALTFSPRGSSVRLCSRRMADDRIEIAVTDQGPGIPAESFAKLFQPFSQLPGDTLRGGTGLGLAISRQIVQAMGGEIAVRSPPGRGATFTLTLRAAAADAQPSEESQFARLAVPAGCGPDDLLQVLYIEDEPVNALMVRKIFEFIGGVQLHEASSLAAGRGIAETLRLDLILVDMNLPDGHGLAALPTLRAACRSADAAIVALSADALPESIRSARAAGFDDYLTKPVAVQVLQRLLSRFRTVGQPAESAETV